MVPPTVARCIHFHRDVTSAALSGVTTPPGRIGASGTAGQTVNMSARAPIRARTFSGSRRSQRDSPVSGCAAGCVAADRQGSVDGLSALVVAAVVAWRLVNALLVQSSFVPDEYWQALEVAHRWVFGYGHLTWEWSFGLRGVTHPLVFASLYRGLQLLGADTPWAVVHAPRLLQGDHPSVSSCILPRMSPPLAVCQAPPRDLPCLFATALTR